jgi:LPS-assembly lipoprotein
MRQSDERSMLPALRSLSARRRRVCTVFIYSVAVALFSGCGFHPRGSVSLPFSSLYVQVPATSQFGYELKRALRASNARLTDASTDAQATLVIMSEIRERQILSLGGQGRVREYQLRYRLAYQLTDGKSTAFTAPTEILLKRDISFNDSDVLAKESEETLLYRDMQSDAVQQLLRRLQATKLTAKTP